MDEKELQRAEARKRLLVLKKQRAEMEEEVEALKNMLHESGMGLKGNLVDKDGFPIQDTEKCKCF